MPRQLTGTRSWPPGQPVFILHTLSTLGQAPQGGYDFLCSTLDTLEALPSVQRLLDSVVKSRRNGRPGYSPSAMWRPSA